jgi:hypothetical protein
VEASTGAAWSTNPTQAFRSLCGVGKEVRGTCLTAHARQMPLDNAVLGSGPQHLGCLAAQGSCQETHSGGCHASPISQQSTLRKTPTAAATGGVQPKSLSLS